MPATLDDFLRLLTTSAYYLGPVAWLITSGLIKAAGARGAAWTNDTKRVLALVVATVIALLAYAGQVALGTDTGSAAGVYQIGVLIVEVAGGSQALFTLTSLLPVPRAPDAPALTSAPRPDAEVDAEIDSRLRPAPRGPGEPPP